MLMIEENYLYPGDEVTPIEVGDGYRDYWLSEVLKHSGHIIEYIEEPYGAFSHYKDYVLHYDIILVQLSGGKCILLAPANSHRGYSPLSSSCCPDSLIKETLFISEEYADLIIRYYFQDGVVKRPVWVSTEVIRKYYLNNPEEKELGPFTDRLVSGYEHIPYCTELIEGPLIEPELALYGDIVNRILKSPFIDYADDVKEQKPKDYPHNDWSWQNYLAAKKSLEEQPPCSWEEMNEQMLEQLKTIHEAEKERLLKEAQRQEERKTSATKRYS